MVTFRLHLRDGAGGPIHRRAATHPDHSARLPSVIMRDKSGHAQF
jgi:hypothetical protein